MKSISKLVLVLTVALFSRLSLCDETRNLFAQEYMQMKGELMKHHKELGEKLTRIRNEQKQAIANALGEAKRLKDGNERLERYARIITSRYVSKEGEYLPGLRLTKKDFDNINALFESYLNMTPFQYDVSAGHAYRTLVWGVKETEMRYRTKADPNEKNDPTLEILALQLQDAAREERVLQKISGRLGIDMEGDRKVASE